MENRGAVFSPSKLTIRITHTAEGTVRERVKVLAWIAGAPPWGRTRVPVHVFPHR
ncbi:MAG: hypothetical protein QXZ31_10470 [Thermofilaceae archaeon]